MEMGTIFGALGGAVLGLILGVLSLILYQKVEGQKKRLSSEKEADKILNKAKSSAARSERDSQARAKDFESRARRNVESDIRKQKQKLKTMEGQLKDKEGRLEKDHTRKLDVLTSKISHQEERGERLGIAQERVKDMEKEANERIVGLREKLENLAGMSRDQALEELKQALENEARQEASEQLTEIEAAAEKEASSRSREILARAMARHAAEVATERTVSIVSLTSEEMKGKIIGREGRNIRTLEAACGVDLIIDETPEAVVISCFDPVRRETARRALIRLMEDGRVHPARIEEVVSKVKTELLSSIREDGERACLDLGLANIHNAILTLLGSLKYRQTGTQNLLSHSVEVGELAGLLAAEIGGDVSAAKRAGLLHDIGLAIDHTMEGSHSKLGAEFARKHGERENIAHAIAAHEGEMEARSILAHLVQAANNFAKARPGAKRNMMETYIKRLRDLESIGNSFDGVARTFAIQAGKEIRVMVDSGKVTDDQSVMLSRDIARKIERELNYPGQIKVSVVRETRIVEHAR